MAIQEVNRTPTADPNAVEEPKIVKVAKLALILADKYVEDTTKLACLRLGVKVGIVTEKEATELLLHKDELVALMSDTSDDDS